MKKKLLFSLLIVLGLLFVTGCGAGEQLTKDGKAKASFVDLKYKEPTDFVKKEPYDIGEGAKTLVYRLDNTDENVNISMYYNKGKGYDYISDSSDQYTEKDINGTTWRMMHNENFDISTDTYYVVYNDALYQIELNGIDKNKDMSSFMDEVSFS